MKILSALAVAAAIAAAAPLAARAEDDGIDPVKAAAFDKRMFAGPLGEKASACFVRRYDARHLAQHPKQKIAAMKLLVTAEKAADEPTSYGYRMGVQYRNRPGDFDAGSSCGHMVNEDRAKDIRFACEMGCGSRGLEIGLSKGDKSVTVRLDAIAVWDRKYPDGETESLQGGAHDKVFRLDRVDSRECDELLEKRGLASLAQ